MSFLNAASIRMLLLQGVLQNENGIILGNQNHVKENSLQLSIGPEAFATMDPKCKDRNLIDLKKKKIFHIESGQFALVHTDEIISVPENIMGFINLNTEYKYKGLVNVSGFHVNPGWKGRIIFTVYNAGPHSIPLRYNEFAFRIWFATLENVNSFNINMIQEATQITIDGDKIYNIDGETFSPHILGKKMRSYEEKLAWRWVAPLATILLSFSAGMAVLAGSTIYHTFTGDNKLLLKEQLIAEIKDQIVDEALKQIQEHSTLNTDSNPTNRVKVSNTRKSSAQ